MGITTYATSDLHVTSAETNRAHSVPLLALKSAAAAQTSFLSVPKPARFASAFHSISMQQIACTEHGHFGDEFAQVLVEHIQ